MQREEVVDDIIRYIDMFSGIGGFREGLTRAGGFECAGHCEIDAYADRSYRALFDTDGEWFCADARDADPAAMPRFDLLCGGFPCQSFSIAGRRGGFGDPRGTLFFELARLAEARHPQYLLFDPKIQYKQNIITEYGIFDGTGRREATPARAACVLAALADNEYQNVPGLLSHDNGRTFAAILDTLDGLGYGVEWQVLDSKDHGVPQARRRVYIAAKTRKNSFCGVGQGPPTRYARVLTARSGEGRIRGPARQTAARDKIEILSLPDEGGYLNGRCAGKILPFTETAGTSLVQVRAGKQGERVYSPAGVSCTLSAGAGGFAGRTGLYDVAGLPIKEATNKGYKLAYPGDSIDISYATKNTRRGRVGYGIAHTLTTGSTQGTLVPDQTGASPYGRVRRLTPRECLRLQGWRDEQIDKVLAIQSDNQAYRQAGNGVTVTVIEAIGRRLAAADAELRGVRDGS